MVLLERTSITIDSDTPKRMYASAIIPACPSEFMPWICYQAVTLWEAQCISFSTKWARNGPLHMTLFRENVNLLPFPCSLYPIPSVQLEILPSFLSTHHVPDIDSTRS
jgi:hypothetical protein